MASVSAIPAGKERTAVCGTMNARSPIATAMGSARTASAFACAASKASSARKSTARIRRATDTALVWTELVCARKAGKEPTAARLIKTRCNACPTARGTANSISRLKLVTVIRCGLEKTALEVSA